MVFKVPFHKDEVLFSRENGKWVAYDPVSHVEAYGETQSEAEANLKTALDEIERLDLLTGD